MADNLVRTVCFECHSRCGVYLHIKDGKIEGIEGDKEHPISMGFVCPKGRAVKEIVYHPDRLTYPLKRAGARGDNKWERVGWDEALGEIAARMSKIRGECGPESIVLGHGTSRGLNPYMNYFLRCLGSPNKMMPTHVSGGPIALGTAHVCGFPLLGSHDYANTRCVVLWALNPPHSWPGHTPPLLATLKRGAKLIVIDSRRSDLVSRADLWLQPRPGTDCALALSMLNVIIEEGLYDRDFVEKWTLGFDRLREHVKAYPPEKMAAVTWVPAGLVREATRLYVKQSPACVCFGTAGLCQHFNSVQTNRAIAMVVALAGNLEVPGGNLNYRSPLRNRSQMSMDLDSVLGMTPEQSRKRLGADQFKMVGMTGLMFAHPRAVCDAILSGQPYPVKAMLLFAHSPLLAYSNSTLTRQALMKLDLLVSVDYFMNPTAGLADFVLPAAHWSERDDVEDYEMHGFAFAQQKAVEPRGECRDEKGILVELGKRLGLAGYWKTLDEALDYRVGAAGMTFAQFKEAGKLEAAPRYRSYAEFGGFRTPSGKVELYSKRMEKLGLDPIPVPREPPESPVSTPEVAKEYPMILITGGRHIAYYHSAWRNIPSLRRLSPDPTVDIHPETAQKLGIKDGEWVLVETRRGSITRKTRYFDGIHPQVVHVSHGWWYGYEPEWRRVNVNILTDNSELDSLLGSEPLRGSLCRVRRSPEPAPVKPAR